MSGKVIFVGAGPGDADLISLKGKSVIERADRILYDHLVHPNMLGWAKEGAVLYFVGKQKGAHSKQQSDINKLMVSEARSGCLVVRLKGGDPLIFGRLGEEMKALKEANISYEIIPGITSAISVPGFAGIPVTHRSLSRSVAFVTGTTMDGGAISQKLLPQADTLVFMMAVSHIKEILDALCTHPPFSKDTPVAFVEKGSTAEQRVLVGTVGTFLDTHSVDTLAHPAILVVGKVAALAQELNWADERPLFGRRCVVLRTPEQAGELTEALTQLGADVIQAPVIEIQPNMKGYSTIDSDLLQRVTKLIFTSPNGVRQMKSALKESGLDSRQLANKKIIAIGEKTALTLEGMGIHADLIAKKSTQEGLLNVLGDNLEGDFILIPTSTGARMILKDGLERRGATVFQVGLYDTVMPALPECISIQDGDRVLFTSSSTARHFFESELYSEQSIQAYAIGPITAETVKAHYDGPLTVSEAESIRSLVAALLT